MAKKGKKPPPLIASLFHLFGWTLLLGGIAVAATDRVFDDPVSRAATVLLAIFAALFHFGLALLMGYGEELSNQLALFMRRQENHQKVMVSLMKAIENKVPSEPLVLPAAAHPPITGRGSKTSLDHYYHDGISQHGPFRKQDMQDLIDGGEIGPDTQVYIEGWEKWIPLREVPTGSFAR